MGKISRTLLALAMALSLVASGCTPPVASVGTGDYGVFLGIDAGDVSRLDPYDLVVVEPEEFTSEDVAELHAEGKTVYAYLNVGAIEEYRDYYDRFSDLSLGVYEDWPDERWVDVTDREWQDFVVELAEDYAQAGFDGFFLDNMDVYYHYPTDEVFDSLAAILARLQALDVALVANGADEFVSRCIDEGVATDLLDAVNQECVFTSIDFDTRTYGAQDADETDYFTSYIEKAHAAGLSVYLLEYGADEGLVRQIDAYCEEHGFAWYNAPSLDLT